MSASVFENESIVAEVAVDRAARRLADGQQAAHLAARVPVAGRRAGPGRGLVGDDRVRRAVRAVDERDVQRAAVELLDRDLAVAGELVEQQVAAVHQVVRRVAVAQEARDRLVQAGELGGDLVDLAAGAGDRVVLALGRLLRGDHLRAHGVDRVGERAGLLHERLLGGRAVGRLGEVRPGVPELGELGVDAVVAGLGERQLGGVERLGLGLPVVQARVLRRGTARSRNWSRMRRKPWTSTPEPRWAPVDVVRAGDLQLQRLRGRPAWPPGASSRRSRRWRCCGRSVSSIRCWAMRPRSDVCMP